MKALPPGTILQLMYLKQRIKKLKLENFTFLELGAGTGAFSNLILNRGGSGVGVDLNMEACDENRRINNNHINKGDYKVVNDNFLLLDFNTKFDLIISAFVIEHLSKHELEQFINKCKNLLSNNGVLILLVPAVMKYWGVEDEIAGHVKRYENKCFNEIESDYSLSIHHIAGLTFPLSNILLPLSNAIVEKEESSKRDLSVKEQTVSSGYRKVMYKTSYPWFFKLFLNSVILWPFHFLQNRYRNHKDSLVIYCELQNSLL